MSLFVKNYRIFLDWRDLQCPAPQQANIPTVQVEKVIQVIESYCQLQFTVSIKAGCRNLCRNFSSTMQTFLQTKACKPSQLSPAIFKASSDNIGSPGLYFGLAIVQATPTSIFLVWCWSICCCCCGLCSCVVWLSCWVGVWLSCCWLVGVWLSISCSDWFSGWCGPILFSGCWLRCGFCWASFCWRGAKVAPSEPVQADIAADFGSLDLGGTRILCLGHYMRCKRESPMVMISSPTGIGSLMCLALGHM